VIYYGTEELHCSSISSLCFLHAVDRNYGVSYGNTSVAPAYRSPQFFLSSYKPTAEGVAQVFSPQYHKRKGGRKEKSRTTNFAPNHILMCLGHCDLCFYAVLLLRHLLRVCFLFVCFVVLVVGQHRASCFHAS
jgi:hypothetical protein